MLRWQEVEGFAPLQPNRLQFAMRAIMFDHVFRYDLFINAVLLNVVYLTLAGFVFTHTFKIVRRLGLLLSTGE